MTLSFFSMLLWGWAWVSRDALRQEISAAFITLNGLTDVATSSPTTTRRTDQLGLQLTTSG
jgi:hypothetical protein